MKAYLLTFFLFSLSHSLPHEQIPLGQPTDEQPVSPFNDSFDKVASHALQHFQVPGFSVSVVDGDSTFAKGYGIAEYPDRNATGDTLYFVGSTTKSFTATSLLKLIEQSADFRSPISLRSKIIDFIPWKLQDDYVTSHATLEDALSHSTGMPRHDQSYGGPNFSVQDAIDSLQYLPLTREIRQEWQYCNLMYLVLTQIVENLSGSKLATFFKKNIWTPLGMEGTYMDLDAAKKSGKLATGYFYDSDSKKYLPQDYVDPDFVSGAGGIISSVSDYAKYLHAMMHRDPALLSPQSYQELRTGRSVMPDLLPGSVIGPSVYSLGWMINVYNGVEIHHHTGGVPGFATIMLHVPEKDWAVAVMNNEGAGGSLLLYHIALELLDRRLGSSKSPDFETLWTLVKDLRRDILKNIRSIAFPDAPPPEKAIKHTLPLDAYTGSYWNDGYRFINLTLTDAPSYVGVPVPSEDGKILRSNVSDRAWPHLLDFEHVSAEHFIVRWHFDMPEASNFDLATEAMKAEFEIGSNGKVARMGLGYEPLMGFDNLIWFDKVE